MTLGGVLASSVAKMNSMLLAICNTDYSVISNKKIGSRLVSLILLSFSQTFFQEKSPPSLIKNRDDCDVL